MSKQSEASNAFMPARKCAECGKTFYILDPSSYTYKRDSKFFCSWSCYRKEHHRREEKKRGKVLVKKDIPNPTQAWKRIPIGRENAITTKEFCKQYSSISTGKKALKGLYTEINTDKHVIAYDGKSHQIWRTDKIEDIEPYKLRLLAIVRNCFAKLQQLEKITAKDDKGFSALFTTTNRIATIRKALRLTQTDVCKKCIEFGYIIDVTMLSKLEMGHFLPTSQCISALASVFGCAPSDVYSIDLIEEFENEEESDLQTDI